MFRRLLAGALAVAVTVSAVVMPTSAEDGGKKLGFHEVSSDGFSDLLQNKDKVTESKDDIHYADTDEVRVSIVLEDASTIKAGFDVETIAENAQAIAYRDTLKVKQQIVETKIENATNEDLDVVHNLTLAANIISANVKYGQIKEIEKISGIKSVIIETEYEAAKTVESLPNDPNMSTSSSQIGSNTAWSEGYTGAGTQIAIIDTGLDIDHQSFNEEAYLYSLGLIAEEKGMTLAEYKATLDLLNLEKIKAVKDQLNVDIDPSQAVVSEKIPFAYNYVDRDYDPTHENDTQGEHGSHVTGISAANKYVKDGEQFVPAIEKVFVQGVAPDAQIITMKVFGKGGGAYDSDYMPAIEDAIVLGADSINLSLGSANGGTSKNGVAEYQKIFEDLAESGVVVSISAGNAGHWADNASTGGYLYADDVNTQTNGSPGSFTNAFTVASADNNGFTGEYFTIGDKIVYYTQSTDYGNKALTTLAGEQEYVFLDAVFDETTGEVIAGYGSEEEWAAIGDALRGKIAVCSRGTSSFFEKANYAVAAGAIGVIIYNNTTGTLGLNLTGYMYEAPVVSITQAEGALFKTNGTAVNGEDGKPLYYTGKIDIKTGVASEIINEGGTVISDFSSWGVSGSLELKPDITAPGGNIYSVNGYHTTDMSTGAAEGGHDQYENMSGTSMAAPQIAGMSALAAQYIKENKLDEKLPEGVNTRTLIQSLLMSTAEPLLEDLGEAGLYYYPVFRQGAGLANISNVIKAESYIIMDDDANAGAKDGKVKVELGDDPDKSGVYSFGFTIYNLTESAKAYTLSADMFTQYLDSDSDNVLYMSTSTENLDAVAEFDCGDVAVVPAGDKIHVEATITLSDSSKTYLNKYESGVYVEGFVYAVPFMMYDFNGDGKVNTDDGQALLDYRTGVISQITNEKYADLDSDGDVDTYDAYLFLNLLETGKLNAVEGEGILGTTHSVPVFGFYGDWSTASDFDKGSYIDYFISGEEGRLPYLAVGSNILENLSALMANVFGVTFGGDEDATPFGGNPFDGTEDIYDAEYYPERNAVNNTDGTALSIITFTPIRAGADSRLLITNNTTGKTIVDTNYGAIDNAFYYDHAGAWYYGNQSIKPNYDFSGAKENDTLTISFDLAPEYYIGADGKVDWSKVDGSNALSVPVTIDNTAPVIKEIVKNGNTLSVTIEDNQYVAFLALTNKGGTKTFAAAGSLEDAEAGKACTINLDITGINEDKLYLQVYDYARNLRVVEIEDIGEGTILPERLAFDLDNGFWAGFDKEDTEAAEYDAGTFVPTAATIVDHLVYACDEDGYIYVMPENDLSDVTVVTNLGVPLTDMAYSEAYDLIFGVVNNRLLVAIDKLSGQFQLVGYIPFTTNTLACDPEGNFYSNELGTGKVYKYDISSISNTPPSENGAELIVEVAGISSRYIQAMEYDPNTGLICWNSFSAGAEYNSYYIEIDADAKTFTKYNDLTSEFSALIIPDTNTERVTPEWAAPTDEITGVMIDSSEIQYTETGVPYISLLNKGTTQLSAIVAPWTARDKSVSWEVDDPTIAKVDGNGVVTALKEGQTAIFAVSNADETVYDGVYLIVENLDVTISGGLQDAEGNPVLFDMDLSTGEGWKKTVDVRTSILSSTLNTNSGNMYIMDTDEDAWGVHEVDPDTGDILESAANTAGVPFWDMAFSEKFSAADAPTVAGIYGYYFIVPSDPMALVTRNFNLQEYLNMMNADFFTSLANIGEMDITDSDDGAVYSTEGYAALDNAGNLWVLNIFPVNGGMNTFINYIPLGIPESFAGIGDNITASMVLGDDGNLYAAIFNGTSYNIYQITFDLEVGEGAYRLVASLEDDVWPVTITSVTVNQGASGSGASIVDNTDAVTARPQIFAADKNAALTYKAAKLSEKVTAVDMTAEEIAAATLTTVVDAASGDKEEVNDSEGESHTSADVKDTTIDVNVVAKDYNGENVDTNNGLFRIKYDTEALELKKDGITVNSEYESVKLDETKGEIVIGYVNPDENEPIKAGEDAVNLEFTIKDETKVNNDSVIVNHVEISELNIDTPRDDDPEPSEDFITPEKPIPEDKPENPEKPGDNTPTGVGIAILPAVISAAAVIMTRKRERRRK